MNILPPSRGKILLALGIAYILAQYIYISYYNELRRFDNPIATTTQEYFPMTNSVLITHLNISGIQTMVIMGQLRAGQAFDFSGSTDPCAVMHLTRGSQMPGTVSDEAVERYVAAISEHVQNTLGIHKSRFMIFYHEHDLALIGNDGRTLKRIWSEIGTFPSD